MYASGQQVYGYDTVGFSQLAIGNHCYSLRKLFTGFILAALIV